MPVETMAAEFVLLATRGALGAMTGARAAAKVMGSSGRATCKLMNGGWELAQASASCLVSKKRSTTRALRSAALRPDKRAALRFNTAVPVSAAVKMPSGKRSLLP